MKPRPFRFGVLCEQMDTHLYQRRERFGFSYYVVTDQHLQTLAPVVAQLAGKA